MALPTTSVIVTAAGSGRRMGSRIAKQFLELRGKPLFVYPLDVFDACEYVSQIILVVPEKDLGAAGQILNRYSFETPIQVTAGGKERSDSIRNGLAFVSDEAEMVLIHDGVRPFIQEEKVREVVQAIRHHGAALLAVPMTDTVKRADGAMVSATLDRSILWRAQTPQGARTDWLKSAYQAAARDSVNATDDAALLERLGKTVALVPGDEKNIKITTPFDLKLAELILEEM